MVSYRKYNNRTGDFVDGLNPYCSGRWSRTYDKAVSEGKEVVLILIVVEDGLVHGDVNHSAMTAARLNPYCSGRWSRTISCCSLTIQQHRS